MEKTKIAAAVCGALLMTSATALATPLASYTHNYGNQPGQVDPGGTDPLSDGYVTVSDQSSQRFSDSFDFSGLNYSSIDQFDLTLNFSSTNSSFLGIIPLEFWFARPGGTSDYFSFSLDRVGRTETSQTFVVDSSLQPQFNDMLAAGNFYFWFAEEGLLPNNFKLYSAQLDIDGQAPDPVPEPGTIFLLGIGLAGVGVFRRRRTAA